MKDRSVGRNARLLEPAPGPDGVRDSGQLQVHEGDEFLGGDGGKPESGDVVADKSIEAGAAHRALEEREEAGALLVGNRGEGVVGIDAREIGAKLREGGAGSESGQLQI